MENIIYKLRKKIINIELKQINSFSIINTIEHLGKEKEHYDLLLKHTKRVADCDTKLEKLRQKKEKYENLEYDMSEHCKNKQITESI